jgi:hypothetical protein
MRRLITALTALLLLAPPAQAGPRNIGPQGWTTSSYPTAALTKAPSPSPPAAALYPYTADFQQQFVAVDIPNTPGWFTMQVLTNCLTAQPDDDPPVVVQTCDNTLPLSQRWLIRARQTNPVTYTLSPGGHTDLCLRSDKMYYYVGLSLCTTDANQYWQASAQAPHNVPGGWSPPGTGSPR